MHMLVMFKLVQFKFISIKHLVHAYSHYKVKVANMQHLHNTYHTQ
jgi:hypothetical protein